VIYISARQKTRKTLANRRVHRAFHKMLSYAPCFTSLGLVLYHAVPSPPQGPPVESMRINECSHHDGGICFISAFASEVFLPRYIDSAPLRGLKSFSQPTSDTTPLNPLNSLHHCAWHTSRGFACRIMLRGYPPPQALPGVTPLLP
jgi:hypothetical protein